MLSITPVEPLADEVESYACHNVRCEGHEKIGKHGGHLLSQGRSRLPRFILAKNFLRGKLLKIFSACDKLCAVNENTTQSDHKTGNKNRTPSCELGVQVFQKNFFIIRRDGNFFKAGRRTQDD